MPKQAISITLGVENLTWLRGRVKGGSARNVSDLLDQLVTRARTSGDTGGTRSVVGTIELDQDDPDLATADAAVRDLFERSIGRPFLVRETRTRYGPRRAARTPRRG
jgi:hypothetical protein